MPVDVRQHLAILTSKSLASGIRLSGRGGGTSFPGLVATTIDPRLLNKLACRLTSGTVVVAGTNGKTTTSRMLAGIFERQGMRVVHNRSGSNLASGISAAFAEQMPFSGASADIGVIECDENAFPEIVERVNPRVVMLLNLFRDQLDRYGELETIAATWRPALTALDRDSFLVVNVDDPNLAALASESAATVVTFGLETDGFDLPALPHAADAAICRVCESRLDYDTVYLSHLGAFRCPNCGNSRPRLDFGVTSIIASGVEQQEIDVDLAESGRTITCRLSLPGLYNVYNALAATATACTLGVDEEAIEDTLAAFEPAFGRLEKVRFNGLQMTLALAKNPVGFNELIRMLRSTDLADSLVIAINDLDADGRDVSWLWDVDFEILVDELFSGQVLTAGIRGYDMAVRMKYAGLEDRRLDASQSGRPFAEVLDYLADTRPSGERIAVLLTYTALLQFRRALAERGAVVDFWEQ